ncbi:MAG: hypothetical protein J5835_07375 [Bacteroidales bacterium]|nr:hypothetical protein [Bacteroidales bacterium]
MLKVGQVLKSNGTDGELLVSFLTIGPEDIDTKEPVFIYFDGLPVPFYFEGLSQKGSSRALVHLTGVHCLKDADELSGRDIFADYFVEDSDEDLTGWTVLKADGSPAGTVTGHEDIPGNLCIYVQTGKGEVLLPLHEDLILGLDKSSRTVTLQIPEGLLP